MMLFYSPLLRGITKTAAILHPISRMLAAVSLLLGAATTATSAGRVRVSVSRVLAASPAVARAEWLSFTWACGGGLPVTVLRRQRPSTRLLLPLLMEEELVEEEMLAEDSAVPLTLRYRVTDDGLLRSELVPGSHSASLTFAHADADADAASVDRCELTWRVEFECVHRQWLWQAVTERLITDAVSNLCARLEATASPDAGPLLVYCHTQVVPTRLISASADGSSSSSSQASMPAAPIAAHTTTAAAIREWVSFVWRGGGGLPLPAPIILAIGAESGEGCERLIVPPLLREGLERVDEARGEIEYRYNTSPRPCTPHPNTPSPPPHRPL